MNQPSVKAYTVEGRLNALGLYSDPSDIVRYANTDDGNPYSAGIYSQFLTGAVTINSTSPITIWSFGVAAGNDYRIHGILTGTEGASPSQINFQFNGPSFSNLRIDLKLIAGGPTINGSTLPLFITQLVNMNTQSDPLPNGNNIQASANFVVEIDGALHNPSATGTVNVCGNEHTGGDPWTANAWSFLDVWPM